MNGETPRPGTTGPLLVRRRISLGWALLAILAIAFLALPFVVANEYVLHILTMIFLFGYLATAWGLVGQTGQLSFGHAAFLGIGGYTSTILFMDYGVTPWLGMFVGAAVAVAVGLAIGYPTLRLRGPYFALATLAFGQILMTYVMNTDNLGPIHLRGALGLVLPIVNSGDAPEVFQFPSKTPYYFIALCMLTIAVGLSYLLNRSRTGLYWAAIRGDQDAAESLGIDAPRYRLLAMLISVALTAFAGTFYAQFFYYINAERGMGLSMSIEIAMMGVVGGWQTVLGPLMGAVVLTPVSEIIRARLGGSLPGLHLLLYGLLLMAVILWLPGGLNDPVLRAVRWIEAKIWPRVGLPLKEVQAPITDTSGDGGLEQAR